MAEKYQVFDLIQEITRLDGSRYFELGNVMMNGRAEKAAMKGFIKRVRIVQLNIAHLTSWEEWDKPEGPIRDAYHEILKQNHVG